MRDSPLYRRERLARQVREAAKAAGHRLKKFDFSAVDCGIVRGYEYEGYVSCKECLANATISTYGATPIDWRDGGLQRPCAR